jgi:ABC-type lipoprotein release transport system permease subunit
MSGGSARLSAIAWRNLWRHGRRTLITLSGIAFGIMLSVIFTGIGDGAYSSMIDYAARLGSGHVSIQHAEYLELPSMKKTVSGTEALAETARAHPRVTNVVTRISGAAMLSTAANSQGAGLIAYDPTREDEQSLVVLEAVDEGELLSDPHEKGIILGATLAENLDTKLGRKVVITLTDKSGEIVSGLTRVKGIMHSGGPSVDGGLALLPIGTVQDLLGYAPNEATNVAIFVDDNRVSEQVAADLATHVPPDAVANTWQETQAELAGFIVMKRGGMLVMEVIILLLISAGIFNTLFVSVMERVREFGIMMALGFTPGQLFGLVMWESVWMGLGGITAGALITAWPYHYLATTGIPYEELVGEGVEVAGVAPDPVMYVAIYPEKLIVIGAVVVIATLLAGVYPAWKAGRVHPVETIKLV